MRKERRRKKQTNLFLELFDGGKLQTVVMIVGETTVMNSSGAVAGRKIEPRSNKYELKIINKNTTTKCRMECRERTRRF